MRMNDIEFITLSAKKNDNWKEWNEFIVDSPCGSFYLSHEWLNAVATGMNHDIYLHIMRDSKSILAGAAVRCAKKLFFKAGKKPWATAYNGPLISKNCNSNHLAQYAQYLFRLYNEIRLVHHPLSLQDGISKEFINTKAITGILDISDLDNLWNRFDVKVRQRIRKSDKLGVHSKEIDDVEIFYKLYCKTYRNHNIDMPLTLYQLCKTLNMARLNANVKIFCAFNIDYKPAAALVVGGDLKRAYFILAGSDPEYRKTDAMTHLWWYVINYYAEKYKEIDLVGLGVPSVNRFKRTFRPIEMEHIDSHAFSTQLKGQLLKGRMWVKGKLHG